MNLIRLVHFESYQRRSALFASRVLCGAPVLRDPRFDHNPRRAGFVESGLPVRRSVIDVGGAAIR